MPDNESFVEIMKNEGITTMSHGGESSPESSIEVVLPFDSGDDGEYDSQKKYLAHGFDEKKIQCLQKSTIPQKYAQDLHGFTVKEAHSELGIFLTMALGDGRQVVYVIHGRGLHSRAGHSVLRPKVHKWLSNCDDVLAWVSCLHNDGAIRVWLRKRQHS